MSNENGSDDGYKVGNKHPPKHSQFKKGESGNPNGRRPGSKGIKARILEQLEQTVMVKQGGKTVKRTKGEVIALQLVEGSMRGDLKTAATLMRLVEGGKETGSASEGVPPHDSALPDEEALRRIRDRLNRKLDGKSS
jgi:hypothetical protein